MTNKIRLFSIFNIIIRKSQNRVSLGLISRYISYIIFTGGRHSSIRYDIIIIPPPQIRVDNNYIFLMENNGGNLHV